MEIWSESQSGKKPKKPNCWSLSAKGSVCGVEGSESVTQSWTVTSVARRVHGLQHRSPLWALTATSTAMRAWLAEVAAREACACQ